MFGIGAQEMLLIGLLCLLVFGPGKLTSMARDLGGFVRKARESVDEFRSEFALDGHQDDYREEFGDSLYGGWDPEDRKFEASEEVSESRAAEPGAGLEASTADSSEEPWPEHAVVGNASNDEAAPDPARAKGEA